MDTLGFVTSFFDSPNISIFEGVMLVCFGLSWPVSIIKALRTKIVRGKSPLFITLIAIGYLFGISHKILYSRDYLVVLYLFNLTMILTDLYLYTRYNLAGARVNVKIDQTRGVATSEKSDVPYFYHKKKAKMIALS